jgi:DnaJ-class molecular chaperone
VRLRVWVPTRLSSADKKLLEELRKSEGQQPPPPSRSLFERVRDAFGG